MTTATYHISNSAPAQPSSVGDALRGLAVAAHSLVSALWAAASARSHVAPQALTRCEEANELRAFASTLAASDPGFASDLYAAADRHESGDRA